MTLTPELQLRINFLARVVQKELRHLINTDARLFTTVFTSDVAASLENDMELAERVEAFVSRFGRLQDTIGDKFLPLLLTLLGEKSASAIDNLDRAERLGLLKSADEWLTIRKLRNQIFHEYVEEPEILASALQAAHSYVVDLHATASAVLAETTKRGWITIESAIKQFLVRGEPVELHSPSTNSGRTDL